LNGIEESFCASEKFAALRAAYVADVFGAFAVNQRLNLLTEVTVFRTSQQQLQSERLARLDGLAGTLAGGKSAEITHIILGVRSKRELRNVHAMGYDGGGLKLWVAAP